MSATLPGDIRDLLAAVLAAIDIPHPRTVGDVPRRREVLAERAMQAAITLERVLRADGTAFPADLVWETAYLREQLAANPPSGYVQWPATPPMPPEGGGGR
jgi:hypothetical protein